MIKLRRVPFFLTFLLVFPTCVFAQLTVFKQLKNRFETGKVFSAQLHHRFVDGYTHDTTNTVGRIWIAIDKYKIILPDRFILVNGVTSKVYNGIKNQVIISNYDPSEDDYAPTRFLAGSNKTYRIKESKTKSGYQIQFTSTDPFAIFKTADIDLNMSLVPLNIRAVDQTGNITLSRFINGRFITPDSKMFTIAYPDSAEVIDLRK